MCICCENPLFMLHIFTDLSFCLFEVFHKVKSLICASKRIKQCEKTNDAVFASHSIIQKRSIHPQKLESR